jgi:hypothetical protein
MKKKQAKIKPIKPIVKKKPSSKTKLKQVKSRSCSSSSCVNNSNKFVLWWHTFKKYFKF